MASGTVCVATVAPAHQNNLGTGQNAERSGAERADLNGDNLGIYRAYL